MSRLPDDFRHHLFGDVSGQGLAAQSPSHCLALAYPFKLNRPQGMSMSTRNVRSMLSILSLLLLVAGCCPMGIYSVNEPPPWCD